MHTMKGKLIPIQKISVNQNYTNYLTMAFYNSNYRNFKRADWVEIQRLQCDGYEMIKCRNYLFKNELNKKLKSLEVEKDLQIFQKNRNFCKDVIVDV